MALRRSYNDSCGIAHALDLIGERWALLIVRELVLGPKRYSDLAADIPGVSSNVLSLRLTELVDAGVVRRRRMPPPAASQVYELTEWGSQLEPILVQLGAWGAESPSHPRSGHLSATSVLLGLRTNFDARAAAGLTSTIQLDLGDVRFVLRVEGGELHIASGVAERPDATIKTSAEVLTELLYGDRNLDDTTRRGAAAVAGDQAAAARFLGLFPLPDFLR